MPKDTLPPVAKMSFEDALNELRGIVKQLDSGDIPLDEAIGIYSRGGELRQHCEQKLKAAEERLLKVSGDDVTPLDDVE